MLLDCPSHAARRSTIAFHPFAGGRVREKPAAAQGRVQAGRIPWSARPFESPSTNSALYWRSALSTRSVLSDCPQQELIAGGDPHVFLRISDNFTQTITGRSRAHKSRQGAGRHV